MNARFLLGCFLILLFLDSKSDGIILSKENREPKFSSSLTSFIIGGKNSPKRPFYVRILEIINGTKKHVCGGTVIHEEWILTAAHCVAEKTPMDIVVETGDFTDELSIKTEVNLTDIIWYIDARRTFWGMRDDIALLKTHEFIFPTESVLEPCPYPVDYCSVLATCGMGRTDPYTNFSHTNILKEIFLKERQPSCACKCPNDVICAKNMALTRYDNICYGDSGGPLYFIGDFPNTDPVCLYGVTSYSGRLLLGTPKFNFGTCYYGGNFFANVPWFYNWIWGTMEEFYKQEGIHYTFKPYSAPIGKLKQD